MNRSTLSLIAVATALAAVTGFATLSAPDKGGAKEAGAAPARLPVERSSLLCPAPGPAELGETAYTSFAPKGAADGKGAGDKGAKDVADLKPSATALVPPGAKKDTAKKTVPAKDKPLLSLTEPGKPAAATAKGAEAPALVGSATGAFAPGWTVQQTTVVPEGTAPGLLGVSCTAPDTDFWIPGASASATRQDYVHLTNPDDTSAVADIELYGPEGSLKSEAGEGIAVPPRSSIPVLLSTLASGSPEDVTVHVTTRTGRVGAVVRAADEKVGADWIQASADPADTLVLPGIPADATSVRLTVYAPGENDADLKVRLVGKSGSITPAGAETLHVKSGMTAGLDLKDLTKGETGSLVLSPSEAGRRVPVVAALRVVRGKGDKQEVAFVPATAPVGERATVADNRAKGSLLALTAPDEAAEVKVTASAGVLGGEPVTKTYTVKAGTTLAVEPPVPAGLKGAYALTVEPQGGAVVYASRTLSLPRDGVPMFTVQTMPDDRGTVLVPKAEQDLSVLDD
ncbi:DUF5719 family protein [Streptomyces sp. NPDC050504]|uniref:DUF5719 family protein n=1 Tax=Streptomyces sp. NPDC050504 TaxID=3365618 RepID=UPI0037BC5BF5